jgi:hypothetical protein
MLNIAEKVAFALDVGSDYMPKMERIIAPAVMIMLDHSGNITKPNNYKTEVL